MKPALKIRVIDVIENEIETYDSIDQINPIIILQRLQEKIDTFKQISIVKNGVFDYKNRFPVIQNRLLLMNGFSLRIKFRMNYRLMKHLIISCEKTVLKI